MSAASALVIAVSLLQGAPSAWADDPVDFQREIRPIFAEHCFQCHGPDEGARQAGLRLDVRQAATSEGKSGGIAILPGKPEGSELLRRVTSDDPNVVMPPPDQKNPLSTTQLGALRRWITEGAPYSSHWAFVAPQRPTVPVGKSSRDAIQNPIDSFVTDRLYGQGRVLSPPAPHDVLCRRIYLDLIGLPPSPREVDQFLDEALKHPAVAVEALVERLVGSQHFGEKWARHWLDVARYADSNGYEKDLRREQWAWRDWVIGAINADMPYDRFIIEQIAGDLLANGTQDQWVASGFLRNGMVNEEGAIVPEQFRMEGLFDRMDCIGKAVLGLSIQCGQCHSHKFDPISQDEYYGMFAFLNDTYEAQSWVYSPEQEKKITEINEAIRQIEDRLKTQRPDWQQQLSAWEREQQTAAPEWNIVDSTEQTWVGGVNHPEELRDHSVLVLGHPTDRGELYVRAEPALRGVTGLRLEALLYGDLPFGGPGRSHRGTFTISELHVETKQPGTETWVQLPLKEATADFSEEERPLNTEKKEKHVGPVAFLIDGKDETGWVADRGPGQRHTESVVVVQFAKAVTLPHGTELKVKLFFHHYVPGGEMESTQLGRMRFALTKSPNPRAAPYDHAATLAMQKPTEDRSSAEQASVFTAWRRSIPELHPIDDDISALKKQFPKAQTSVLHIAARKREHHRETFLLDRGTWDKPKHKVSPHVPAVLHSMPTDQKPNRLTFARWLADRRSPLTARVQVNRVWQAMFGTGLVRTPEDFGTRAPQPEYLQLLDWLAVDFMENGWSLKQLIRTIVCSRTYQQASRVTRQLQKIDPQNRLLARGPRFRVEAEVVRDLVLTVSGLLNHKMGGRSIFPPIPQSVLDGNFTKPLYWVPEEGPERYRRALYVFRKRSMPDPALSSFDAPNADFACAQRARSNTPLAALVSLNEPVFVEAARALALRILREGGNNDEERVDYALRLCTGRRAKPTERAEVLALLQSRRKRLAEGWLSVNEVATGDPAMRPAIPPNTTPQDAAAWTITARVLLNLDETLSKN
jgi:mono/diheme cytochrome c family protein